MAVSGAMTMSMTMLVAVLVSMLVSVSVLVSSVFVALLLTPVVRIRMIASIAASHSPPKHPRETPERRKQDQ